jgi:Sulfotransferase domain
MKDSPGRLPDFIIAGAPRSGTTWLYTLLDRHPEVHMAKPVRPEPKFFILEELYAKGPEYYSRTWFSGVPEGRKCGEKSTNYLENPEAAQRIRTVVPAAKLIFMLREPAERAYSNYLWTRMNGLETESFETALALEAERELMLPPNLKNARPYAYFSRGLYADLLQPFFDRFPRDRILCLKFEEIVANPEALAAATHRFLGIRPRPGDATLLGVINASEKEDEPMPSALKHALQVRYSEANTKLGTLLGRDFEIWSEGRGI